MENKNIKYFSHFTHYKENDKVEYGGKYYRVKNGIQEDMLGISPKNVEYWEVCGEVEKENKKWLDKDVGDDEKI